MKNTNSFDFQIFDSLEDAVLQLENKTTILNANTTAKAWGLGANKELLNTISFNEIDQLAKHILNNEDFEIETNIYFFEGYSKFCKLTFKQKYQLLILQDKTEFELLKKVKEDFITSVSHELRTPLTIAKGNTQILKDFMKDNQFIKQVTKIEESLDRIENIISQLTLLSKAEFGEYELKKEVINPSTLYNEVVTDLYEKIQEKSVKLHFNCHIHSLKGDKFVLYTIFRNLLSNAIKYSYENSDIYIDFQNEQLIIKDEGIGIREEEQKRIFERFYRGVEAKNHAKGSGLGLAVVKYLCELANYKIEFESKWMVGTTFKVFFYK
ncbi:histidine kinase [Petrotoga sp. HKA.pet.4.5]|jgi:two-component system OmpR family sensor kinase|uniref:sensor histidine kinase n=1 Tax=Petrotoga sp. HKA.pet.4.5 TaxID=1473155 RepID=UPI000EF14D9A|nr:ATP-binding protein [Petrotoga sp. HKA.pet.4.5]RLL88693.1 histidine kinase [Petrotoga sp. HKA.pet.4.5]